MHKTTQKIQTFGAQLQQEQERHANDKISLGDMSDAMGFDLMNKVRDFVQQESKKTKKSFYIVAALKKDFMLETVIRVVLQARFTKPKPIPGYWLLRYDAHQDEIFQEWCLPNEYVIAKIEAMPFDYDPQLVKWVKLWREGKL